VVPDEYGDFLIAVFEEWVRHDVGKVFVMNFEWALNTWIGNPSPVCIHAGQCGRLVTASFSWWNHHARGGSAWKRRLRFLPAAGDARSWPPAGVGARNTASRPFLKGTLGSTTSVPDTESSFCTSAST
jgi:hypothetical protein